MAYHSSVYKTPRTRSRPAVLPDSFLPLSGSSAHLTPWTRARPSEQSHFSDSSSSSPPAPALTARPERVDGKQQQSLHLAMSHSLFIASPVNKHQNEPGSFLNFCSPQLPVGGSDASLSTTDSSPESVSSFTSAFTTPENLQSASLSAACGSPASPVLHIKLRANEAGAAEPYAQPVLPSPKTDCQGPRPYDFTLRSNADLAKDLDNFFGTSVQNSKAQRCGYGKIGIARTNAEWSKEPEFEPLLSSSSPVSCGVNHSRSVKTGRQHAQALHHPYARSAPASPVGRKKSKKHRPPPLNLSGISALHSRSERTPQPQSQPMRRHRPLLFPGQRERKNAVDQHCQPLEVRHASLGPSAMPDHGAESGIKNKLSLRNLIHFRSRSTSSSLACHA